MPVVVKIRAQSVIGRVGHTRVEDDRRSGDGEVSQSVLRRVQETHSVNRRYFIIGTVIAADHVNDRIRDDVDEIVCRLPVHHLGDCAVEVSSKVMSSSRKRGLSGRS